MRHCLTAVYLGVLLSEAPGSRAETLIDDFLQDVVAVYGQNPLLDIHGMKSLLEAVCEGRPAALDMLPAHAQCGSVEDILAGYGLSDLTNMDMERLKTICPALMDQDLLPPCSRSADEPWHTKIHVMVYAFLGFTVVKLAVLLFIALIALTRKLYFSTVLTLFIGLAVGAMCSNALLRLILEVPDGSKNVWLFGRFCLLYFIKKALPSPGRCVHQASAKTRKWLFLLSDIFNKFIDGLTIGVSFAVSTSLGFSICITILCKIPREIDDYANLLRAGTSREGAILLRLLSALSCYLGLKVAHLLSTTFTPITLFSLTGGMSFYIILDDRIPHVNVSVEKHDPSMETDVIFFHIRVGFLTGFSIVFFTRLAGCMILG